MRFLLIVVLIIASSATFFLLGRFEQHQQRATNDFVKTRGPSFVVAGKPFRFIGANVAVMYREEDRQRMAETLARASASGIKVVRVWAFGEGGPDDVRPLTDLADWPRIHPFRWAPGQWNEEAFVHLDKVLATAAQNNLRVQLCLANWWRDTGGVTQYLRWAGVDDAADDNFRYGINNQRAMLFYTNPETRRLYREHVEKIVSRRNTQTGILYRDDPTILGWELMNEAQAITGRWSERRAWVSEMSQFLKSLDPNHLVTPGVWGYRSAAERREWLADHALTTIDYCDVHNYPRDDTDSFVNVPRDLREFVSNRTAAAFAINKPLVLGEFGMGREGHHDFSQIQWYREFFESSIRAGAGGAMFWILTPDVNRGYGVAYTSPQDGALLSEIKRSSQVLASLEAADFPPHLSDAGRHLIPRQFYFKRPDNDPSVVPEIGARDGSELYSFKPRMASAIRFEKLGEGPGYLWGYGSGFVEYRVPNRQKRWVKEVIVRAYIKPVLPVDAQPKDIKTRVKLYIEGLDCGSRLIPAVTDKPLIQEWRVDKWAVRLQAGSGKALTVRLSVLPDADWVYGLNISNWPEGFDARGARPLEVEIRQ